MSNTTTLETSDGSATINHELLQQYMQEAFEHLDSKNEADVMFKEVVEAVADATKLKKGRVAKFFKSKHKASLAAAKEEVELFEKLDEIVKS